MGGVLEDAQDAAGVSDGDARPRVRAVATRNIVPEGVIGDYALYGSAVGGRPRVPLDVS